MTGVWRHGPMSRGPHPSVLVAARSAGGQVMFNGREVIIDRAGSVSFVLLGMAGVRAIPLSTIQAVQIQPARRTKRGYLRLKIRGAWNPMLKAAGDQNSVLFDAGDQAAFQRLAAAVRLAIREGRKPVVITSPGDAGEIGRITALHGAGVIGHDEFESLKSTHGQPARQAGSPPDKTVAKWRRLKPDLNPEPALEGRAPAGAAAARAAFRRRWIHEDFGSRATGPHQARS